MILSVLKDIFSGSDLNRWKYVSLSCIYHHILCIKTFCILPSNTCVCMCVYASTYINNTKLSFAQTA